MGQQHGLPIQHSDGKDGIHKPTLQFWQLMLAINIMYRTLALPIKFKWGHSCSWFSTLTVPHNHLRDTDAVEL